MSDDQRATAQALRDALEKPAYTHALALQNIRESLELVLSWIDDWCETGPETGFDLIEEKANAALAEQQAAEPLTWQPIETAPTDGTRVLILCDDEPRVDIGYYEKRSLHGAVWMTALCADFGGYETPTHWMPLPTATTPQPPTQQPLGKEERIAIIMAAESSSEAIELTEAAHGITGSKT